MAQHINKRNDNRSSFWTQLYSYFFYINVFSLSAFLLFWDYYLPAFLVFGINLFIMVVLREKINKEYYKLFYQDLFNSEELRETEIEVSEDGISCQSVDGYSFYRWNNIIDFVETDKTIYFFTKGLAIPVMKNAFEFENQKMEFLIFTKARIPQQLLAKNDSRF